MRVKNVEELGAFEFAVSFKEEVHRIVRAYPDAFNDLKYRSQLWDAADSVESDIGEGFERRNPAEYVNFLRYALGSLAEATRRLKSGITRGYFQPAECEQALVWSSRCKAATSGLLRSQQREAAKRRARKQSKRR